MGSPEQRRSRFSPKEFLARWKEARTAAKLAKEIQEEERYFNNWPQLMDQKIPDSSEQVGIARFTSEGGYLYTLLYRLDLKAFFIETNRERNNGERSAVIYYDRETPTYLRYLF